MARSAQEVVEVLAVSASNKGMVVGAATGLFGWASHVNWIGVSGVAIAAVGLLVNAYFQRRRDRRESAESKARIEALRNRCDL